MSQKKIDPIVLWSGLAVATIATAAVAYAGYRAVKGINDLNLDDVFEDMNEVFFPGLQRTGDQ